MPDGSGAGLGTSDDLLGHLGPVIGGDHLGIRTSYDHGAANQYFILVGPNLLQVAIGGVATSGQTIGDLTDVAIK